MRAKGPDIKVRLFTPPLEKWTHLNSDEDDDSEQVATIYVQLSYKALLIVVAVVVNTVYVMFGHILPHI